MSNFIFWGVIVLQVFVYVLGAYVIFDERKWNPILSFVAICVGVLVKLLFVRNYNLIYMYMIAIIIFFTMLVGKLRHRIFIAIKTIFIIICLEEMIESLVSLCFLIINSKYNLALIQFIIAENILIFILCILSLLKKYFKYKIVKIYMRKMIYIVVGLAIVALMLMTAGVSYAESYVNKQSYYITGTILSIFSYFGIVFLLIFFIYEKNSNENYRKAIEVEKKLRIFQKNNYELLILREEETREFRHNISNHIICLKELLISEDISVVNNYLNEMSLVIDKIQKKSYSTGNNILDAVINYYVGQLEKNIAISIKGSCMYRLGITNMELCDCISNVLQNSIEALHNQNNKETYLRIRLNCKEEYFKIKISNSIEKKVVISSNGMPITSKLDKENHGIGLKNVKKIVESVNGLFQIKVNNNEFSVILILPIEKYNDKKSS